MPGLQVDYMLINTVYWTRSCRNFNGIYVPNVSHCRRDWNFSGTVIGTMLFIWLEQLLQGFQEYRMLIFGPILVTYRYFLSDWDRRCILFNCQKNYRE